MEQGVACGKGPEGLSRLIVTDVLEQEFACPGFHCVAVAPRLSQTRLRLRARRNDIPGNRQLDRRHAVSDFLGPLASCHTSRIIPTQTRE